MTKESLTVDKLSYSAARCMHLYQAGSTETAVPKSCKQFPVKMEMKDYYTWTYPDIPENVA